MVNGVLILECAIHKADTFCPGNVSKILNMCEA